MILSKAELMGRLCKPAKDPQSLVITPLTTPEKSLSSDSVDLRLGTSFILSRSDRLAANIPGHAERYEYQRPVHVPLGRYLVLPGHQTVLASTLEFMKLPYDLAAMVLTKSSWARTFISVENAPWVHPCYRGCLTLEVANMSETALALYPGLRVAQVVFMDVAGAKLPKKELSGKYVGPVRPEAPHLAPPERALKEELGLDLDLDYPWREERNGFGK